MSACTATATALKLTFDRDYLRKQVARVAMAAGKPYDVDVLQALTIELHNGELTLFATDRYRIALAPLEFSRNHGRVTSEPDQAWLPKIDDVKRALREVPAGPVTITLPITSGRAYVRFTGSDGIDHDCWEVGTDMLPLRSFITPGTVTATVNRSVLANALAAMVKADAFTTYLTIDEGMLTLTGRTRDGEEVRPVELGATTHGAHFVMLTVSYLREALRGFASLGRDVTIALDPQAAKRPIMLAPTVADLADERSPYRHVLMIVRPAGA